jgi:hypothetical protein
VTVINLALSIEAPMLDEFSSWSAFESLAVQMSEDIPGQALAQALDELQERLIEQVCGPKWAPQRGLPAPFSCPGCGAGSDFARKGRRTRPRRFDTSAGRVEVRLWHVGCRECGKVFAPLLELMNLHGKRRTDRLSVDLAELSSQMSFRRAAGVAAEFSGREASGGGAHRSVADVAAVLAPDGVLGPAVAQADVVILDGTGVRAGERRLGADCNLAIGLTGRSGQARRRRAHAQLLGLTVGESWSALGQQLESLNPPKVVVVDGEHAVTKVATDLWPDVPQQRCWWHLCRAFRWALYADKAPAPWANERRAELLALLRATIAHEQTTDEALRIYDDFTDAIRFAGHHAATSLLTVARPQVFTCLDPHLRRHLAYLGGPELGSGVIERTMRDINARVDIGGSRWTIAGIRDTITVLAARRFAHPAWQALTSTLRPTNTIPFNLAKFNAG